MIGLVTVGPTDRFTTIAQACFRLRYLNNGQRVNFIVSHNSGLIDRKSILNKLNENEEASMGGETEFLKQMQFYNYIKRAIGSTDSDEKYYIQNYYSVYTQFRSEKEIKHPPLDNINKKDYYKNHLKSLFKNDLNQK